MDGVLILARAGLPPRRIPVRGIERWPATLARLSPRPVAILRHRGHGRPHDDWLLSLGAACATISISIARNGLHASIQPHHRRRYLSVACGPVADGRGAIAARTLARGWWHRSPRGWRICLLKSR
jgi:hypothetical protein